VKQKIFPGNGRTGWRDRWLTGWRTGWQTGWTKNWRALRLGICAFAIVLAIGAFPLRSNPTPVTVDLARVTWNTSSLQVEVTRQLLEELGYKVNMSQVFEPGEFYPALARGETDLWLDAWPTHDRAIDLASASEGGSPIALATPVTDTAIQGYRIDLKTAEEFDITSLADLADPEIAARFDLDGNGKADLMGCNESWPCATTIDRHIAAFGLADTVEQAQKNYDFQIRQTVERYDRGEPVLFYAWTPHAVNRLLDPGTKTRWLSVPEAIAIGDDLGSPIPEPVERLAGCADDPCSTGFVAADIRPAARQEFLQRYPAISQLLDRLFVPIEDIEADLLVQYEGEESPETLRRRATEWIADNRTAIDRWLEESPPEDEAAAGTGNETGDGTGEPAPLRVVTKTFTPFVTYEDGSYTGFSIELWAEIAKQLDREYRLKQVDSVDTLLEDVRLGQSDIGIAGVSMTADREEIVDFSHPFFDSGLQIMVRDLPNHPIESLVTGLIQIVTTPQLYYGIGLFVLTLAIAAHAVWFLERRHNDEFHGSYWRGIWDSFWWSAVTVTTVGYGDKAPRTATGKLFALVWMCAGYFVFAYFIATVTTTFTVDRLENAIGQPDDLQGKIVGTIDASTAEQFLIDRDIRATSFNNTQTLYQALRFGNLDAVVYDAPVLQHYSLNAGSGEVEVVGPVFERQNYGIVLPQGSTYREEVNAALLELREDGTYDEIYARWFGADN